jgi:hypothetical protein
MRERNVFLGSYPDFFVIPEEADPSPVRSYVLDRGYAYFGELSFHALR